MNTLLDWSRFRNGTVGPARAFEAFTAQLFERWVRRTYGSQLTSYVLNGAGGDGGVEAFAKLDDGSVVGLQAKWFPETLGAAQFQQIRRSIDTACTRFPSLRQYVIAFPSTLTKGLGTKKEPKKGGVERWDDLVSAIATAYPNLTAVRWDEASLLTELTVAENHGLRPLWFEGAFPEANLQVAWEKVKAKLGTRYLPDLHAVGSLETMLNADLWTEPWMGATRVALDDLSTTLRGALSTFVDLAGVLDAKATAEFKKELASGRARVERMLQTAGVLLHVIATGPTTLPPEDAERIYPEFGREVQSFKEKEHYWGSLVESAFKAASAPARQLHDIRRSIDGSARLRLVEGPSGCGKTHGLAKAVDRLIAEGTPAVFLMVKGADPSIGIAGLLSATLDLPGWPLGRILDGLEALAILRQTAGAPGGEPGFIRSMVAIDGIEEAPHWDLWSSILPELVVEANRRPRVHFVASARPETFRRLTVPPEAALIRLGEDGGTDLPGMLRRYASTYRVDVASVPWLGWALRNPLEIRLLAEEYAGGKVDAGAATNLLTLFRRKLARVEAEARSRAGPNTWTDQLDLVAAVLDTLATLLAQGGTASVSDSELLPKVQLLDPEFKAERVRHVLGMLVEHGLVQAWEPPSADLRRAPLEYTLATRHIADYLIAHHCFAAIVPQIASGEKVSYPDALRWRDASAPLFAALLAEKGTYVADVEWEDPPGDLLSIHAEALTFVSPAIAGERVREIRRRLAETTATNRTLLDRLVVQVSRIPGHPLGPRILDDALRGLSLAARDPIWSVPDDLSDGPWEGTYSGVLDRIDLDPAVDEWDGRPLIAAWTCSSVVEARRRRAREQLSVWGAQRLKSMTRLVEHAAGYDDAQVVADVLVAALGASCGTAPANPEVLHLALLVDRLFFAPVPDVPTTCVVVRFAARGIIERAAILFPEETKVILERCRPPYAPTGAAWPPLDKEEALKSSHFGGLVHGDLTWYVAAGCFQAFEEEAAVSTWPEPPIDRALAKAIVAGFLSLPALEKRADPGTAINTNEPSSTEPGDPLGGLSAEEVLTRLAEEEETVKEKPRHSPEFDELMIYAAAEVGNSELDPKSVRNAMIAHLVRQWGWSDAFPVDQAIVKAHGHGATHGERSPVATFREKYVWSAIDIIAGALADRMPVWSYEKQQWVRVSAMDAVGNATPDPLPRWNQTKATPPEEEWEPANIVPDQYSEEMDLPKRAEKWLTEAPLPDVTTLVRGAMEGINDATILALDHFKPAHQSCIDQHLELSAFGIFPEDLQLFVRDVRFLEHDWFRQHDSAHRNGAVSPSLACWAPWLAWSGEEYGYNSVEESGELRRVRVLPLVGECTAKTGLDWPGTQTAWVAVPTLARPLKVVSMRGDIHRRAYSTSRGSEILVERDVFSSEVLSFHFHYLVMDTKAFRETLLSAGLIPVWVVHLWREATPALFMKGSGSAREVSEHLKHRRRDVGWLIVEEQNKQEIHKFRDELQPWQSKKEEQTS